MTEDAEERAHEAPDVVARRGFFPAVVGRVVRVDQGGGAVFLAGRELHITQGGGQWLVSLGYAKVQQGGTAAVLANRVKIERGFAGIVLAARVSCEDQARVLMTTRQAAAFAAVLGAAGMLASWIARRRRPAPGA